MGFFGHPNWFLLAVNALFIFLTKAQLVWLTLHLLFACHKYIRIVLYNSHTDCWQWWHFSSRSWQECKTLNLWWAFAPC